MNLPLALALSILVQGAGQDVEKRYPEMVLPHVISGQPDHFDPKRPVVNVRIGGEIVAGDMIFLDAEMKGEMAKRGWANLRKELTRMCGPMELKALPGGDLKVRSGSVQATDVGALGRGLQDGEHIPRRAQVQAAVWHRGAPQFERGCHAGQQRRRRREQGDCTQGLSDGALGQLLLAMLCRRKRSVSYRRH